MVIAAVSVVDDTKLAAGELAAASFVGTIPVVSFLPATSVMKRGKKVTTR